MSDTKLTHLSFTRLKELAHSPLKLKKYIEQTKVSTTAMDEGTLLDCLLFEPEKFYEKFFVTPGDAPKKPTKAQLGAKKPSAETIAQIAAYGEIQAQVKGRIIISQAQLSNAEYLQKCVQDSPTVTFNGLLNPDFFKFQVPVKFFHKGFLHRGIKDASGNRRDGMRCIWDLKRMGARSGESLVRGQIRNNMYDLQAAIYCHEFDSVGEPCLYYIIAVDNQGYVTPFEITRDSREKARIQWNKLVAAAHRVNMEGMDAGPEFWADQYGFFYF